MVSELGSWITGPPPLEYDSKWGSGTVTHRRSVVSSGMSELSFTTKNVCHDMTLDVESGIKTPFHPFHTSFFNKIMT